MSNHTKGPHHTYRRERRSNKANDTHLFMLTPNHSVGSKKGGGFKSGVAATSPFQILSYMGFSINIHQGLNSLRFLCPPIPPAPPFPPPPPCLGIDSIWPSPGRIKADTRHDGPPSRTAATCRSRAGLSIRVGSERVLLQGRIASFYYWKRWLQFSRVGVNGSLSRGIVFVSLVISHVLEHHRVRRVSDSPVVFGSSLDPSRPRMSVAGSPRRSPTCRRRKRLRPGAGWWGPRLRVSFSLLVRFGLWLFGHLCVGSPDLWDRGLVVVSGSFFCGLYTPTFPVVISRRTFLRACDLRLQAL